MTTPARCPHYWGDHTIRCLQPEGHAGPHGWPAKRATDELEAMAAERNEARHDEDGWRARAESAEARAKALEEERDRLAKECDERVAHATRLFSDLDAARSSERRLRERVEAKAKEWDDDGIANGRLFARALFARALRSLLSEKEPS